MFTHYKFKWQFTFVAAYLSDLSMVVTYFHLSAEELCDVLG